MHPTHAHSIRHWARRRHGERGAFLVAVIVFVVVLGGLSLAFLQENIAERTSIHHHETSFAALAIAEAGLIQAELEILSLTDPDEDGIGTIADAYGGGFFDVTAEQDPDHEDRWTLRARGEKELSVRTLEVGIRRRAGGYFIEGLFSRDELTLNGSITTDSYDSRVDTWDALAVNADAGGRYAGGKGHVGSNAGITVHGSKAHIRGNAIPGPLHTVATSGSPVIWGDRFPRLGAIALEATPEAEFLDALANNANDQLRPGGGTAPPPAAPPAPVNGNGNGNGNAKSNGNGNGGGGTPTGGGNSGYDPATLSLRPKGQTQVVLEGGTYFFTDVDLSGGAELVINGPCRIYVTGTLDLTGGGVVNHTGLPTDCLIFAHPYALPEGHDPSGAEVRLTGHAEAALAVYAPDLPVVLSGASDLFGAVVGRTIRVVGDANFHYDEALGEVKGGTTAFIERLFWREVSDPPR